MLTYDGCITAVLNELISTLNFIIDMYKNNNKIDVEVDFNPIRI